MKEMPKCPSVAHCHCFPAEEVEARKRGETHCVCGESEKALRGWLNGRITEPMTAEQREWCYSEIESVESHDRADYINSTDAELAVGVLGAAGILLRQGIDMSTETKEDGECFMCHEQTCCVAGNPSQWPLRLEFNGGNGQTRIYHRGCIVNAISKVIRELEKLERLGDQIICDDLRRENCSSAQLGAVQSEDTREKPQ